MIHTPRHRNPCIPTRWPASIGSTPGVALPTVRSRPSTCEPLHTSASSGQTTSCGRKVGRTGSSPARFRDCSARICEKATRAGRCWGMASGSGEHLGDRCTVSVQPAGRLPTAFADTEARDPQWNRSNQACRPNIRQPRFCDETAARSRWQRGAMHSSRHHFEGGVA